MTDWNSPLTLQQNGVSWTMMIHAFMGIFAWEWITTLDFDLSILLGKRKFRWPMINYLYGRYAFLGSGMSICILLDSPKELNCQIGYRISTALGNTSVSCASLNLCFRTLAVWNQDRRVMFPLAMLSLGHFALAARNIFAARAIWVPGSGCVTVDVEAHLWAILFGYTMVFDLIILILTAYKLSEFGIWKGGRQHANGLARLLFKDGLVYFLIVFVVNTIAVIFSIIYLNPIMGVIADAPAIAISTIVSGRVVRRLIAYNAKDMSLTDVLPPLSSTARRSANHHSLGNAEPSRGVHIEMTTFSTTPDLASARSCSTSSLHAHVP